ncbi:hypothetical protein L6261_02700 [Candidatus Parcubacteria bacterium]|nr:hypothetical protein [Candidatus Parcubacteria bacterium]
MKNVHDLRRRMFLIFWGDFMSQSAEHLHFTEKINGLFLVKGVNPESVEDVDKATEMTEDEYDGLLAEFRRLL